MLPESVSVLLPFFMRAPLLLITPENVELVEELVVRVKPEPSVMFPAPAMAPIVMLLLMARVPASTVVRPEKLVPAPERVSVLVLDLVRLPVPVMFWEIVTLAVEFQERVPLLVML